MTVSSDNPQTSSALKVPPFRLYWGGQVVSMIGGWMQTVAVSWIVLKTTNSAAALGNLLAVQFIPMLVLTLLGGALADCFPKRRVLLVTQGIMCLQSGCLYFLDISGMLTLPALYILSGMLGVAQAFDNPTRQSFIPELVPEKALPSAYALNSLAFNSAKVVGPAVGGFMIAQVGVAGCFLLNTVSFFAVLATIVMLKNYGNSATGACRITGAFASIREGVVYSMGDAAIGPIMMLAAILGIFAYNLNAIVPLIANFILKAGPAGFGNLTAAAGVGSILAAFVLASLGKAEKRTVNVGALGLGGSLLALGLADSWPANSVLLVLYGFFCIIFFTSANTMLQLATRSDMRGRVAGVYILWITGSTPIGSLFIGQMAERFSVHPTLLALGAICTVGTILVIGRGIWRSRRAAGPGVHSPGAEHAGQPPESRGDGD